MPVPPTPDDVDRARVGQVEHGTSPVLASARRACSSASAATRAAASGWASGVGGIGHGHQSARLGRARTSSSAASRSASSSASGTSTAAPARDQRFGVGGLVVAGGDRQRHEHGREADRGRARPPSSRRPRPRPRRPRPAAASTRSSYRRAVDEPVPAGVAAPARPAVGAAASQSRAPTTWWMARSVAVTPAVGETRDGLVDPRRTERSAEDRDARCGRRAGRAPARAASRSRGSVDGQDLGADRVAGDHRARQVGARERTPPTPWRTDRRAGWPRRPRVLLDHHDAGSATGPRRPRTATDA